MAVYKGQLMLILMRRFGESIVIEDKIIVTPIGLRDGEVRLAIEAPSSVSVDRSELRLRKIAGRAGGPAAEPKD
jgi:carbon storage regulator